MSVLLPENLYIPPAHIESVASELGLQEEAARAVLLVSAQDLQKTYSSGKNKTYWTNTELLALNVLLMNRCLRKKQTEQALDDVEQWEIVLQDLPNRLHKMLTETKYSAFKEYIAKMKAEIKSSLHWSAMKNALTSCKSWSDQLQQHDSKVSVASDEEQLHRMFMSLRTQLPAAVQATMSKRLELALQEMESVTKSSAPAPAPAPSPASSPAAPAAVKPVQL